MLWLSWSTIRAACPFALLGKRVHWKISSKACYRWKRIGMHGLRKISQYACMASIHVCDRSTVSNNSSSMATALRWGMPSRRCASVTLVDRPAGIVVFTDGMSTDTLPALQGTDSPVPIYPVVDLGRDQQRDISIIDPTITESALNSAKYKSKLPCVVWVSRPECDRAIVHEKNVSVSEQSLKVDADTFEKRMRFQYRPKEPGIQFARCARC